MSEREKVLREFGKLPRTTTGVYVHADTDAMADEIVRLRAARTPTPPRSRPMTANQQPGEPVAWES
ncbi:MAG: hypothetical protein ACK5QX_11880, partial [bacterium]